MTYKIIRDDITKVSVDAIVNAANKSLLGGGGVDGAIHRAAGRDLKQECLILNGCQVGQAKITKGYNLPAKYVIHTVGPEWKGGNYNEEELLASCYRSSLEIAKEYGLKSIAFPLISTGAFRFPVDKALKIATSEIISFLLKKDMTIYLVVFDKESFKLSSQLLNSIEQYIDDHYVDENISKRNRSVSSYKSDIRHSYSEATSEGMVVRHLKDAVKNAGETFSQMLLRLITEKNLDDSEVYKKANIDRKLFSKIRSNVNYKPSKPTVLAFAIALELNIDESIDILKKAGFAFSNGDLFDIIIRFHIIHKEFNIYEINNALFAFDQKTLGV